MEVARAIADPVRRQILVLLAAGPRPAGAIAAEFAVSRPAVSRHLRVLREHGLVRDEARGRERVYRLDVAPLAELDAWLAELRAALAAHQGGDARASLADRLGASLDALDTEVRRTGRDRRRAAGDALGGASGPPPDTQEKLA
jgi:DNA-binding transcriptional ArsR family regulator